MNFDFFKLNWVLKEWVKSTGICESKLVFPYKTKMDSK